MNRPLETLVNSNLMNRVLFPPDSRYHGIATARWQAPDGHTVVYLMRRFVPAPEQFELMQEHSVTEGERLDNITASYLGNPELFWRLCDANRAMVPDELTTRVGRRLRITLPAGIPGNSDG
jgi:hypothetical protein